MRKETGSYYSLKTITPKSVLKMLQISSKVSREISVMSAKLGLDV